VYIQMPLSRRGCEHPSCQNWPTGGWWGRHDDV